MAQPAAAPERDPDLVAFGSFTGLRNDVAPERFAHGDLAVADNCDLDNTGKLERRDGYALLGPAVATHSLWSDGDQLGFCVRGSVLYKIDPVTRALTSLFTSLSAGRRMSYRKVNDTVYMSNGVEQLAYYAGVVRRWGMPVPSLPGVAVTSGSMPAGTYQFNVTYQGIDQQESGAPGLAGRITVPEGSGLVFTFTRPSSTTIAAYNLYLSTPNGEVLYFANSAPIADGTITYIGTTLDLSYDLKMQFLSGPPAGQIVGYYSSRMYVIADDVLFYSEPFAYELFDLRKYIALDDRGTMLAVMEDKERLDSPGVDSGLFIGTQRSCGLLLGSTPEEFQYVPRLDYGAIEGALEYVDGTLFGDGSIQGRKLPVWLTTQGMCFGMPGMEIRNISRNRFTFAASGRGASLFDSTPNRLIMVSNF